MHVENLNAEEETSSKFYTSGELESKAGILSIRILQLITFCQKKKQLLMTVAVGACIGEGHL